MTTDALYERFECIVPPRHRKFYELEVELSLFYPKTLIRRWGRIGTRHPRTRRGLFASPEELQKAVDAIRRIRIRPLPYTKRLPRKKRGASSANWSFILPPTTPAG